MLNNHFPFILMVDFTWLECDCVIFPPGGNDDDGDDDNDDPIFQKATELQRGRRSKSIERI